MTNTDILIYRNIQFMLHNDVSKSEFLSQPDLIRAVKKMLELYFHTDIVAYNKQVLDLLDSELYQLFLENKQILSEKHKTDFPILSLYEFQSTMKGFTRILNISHKNYNIIVEFMNRNVIYKISISYNNHLDEYTILEVNKGNYTNGNTMCINRDDVEIYRMLDIEYVLLYDLATDKIRRYVQNRTTKNVSEIPIGDVHELYNLMKEYDRINTEIDKLATERNDIDNKIKSILPDE